MVADRSFDCDIIEAEVSIIARPTGRPFKIECPICGRQFTVPDVRSLVPKHPPKGESAQPHIPYVPCPGSGGPGLPVEPVVP